VATGDVTATAGIRGVDHVALVVRDVEASLAYFTGTLGLAVLRDEVTAASGGARLVFLDAGNVAIQLVSPTGPDGPMAAHLAAHGDGLHHVCLAVDDIEVGVAALAPDAGVEIAIGGRGRRTAFLPGAPGGLITELAEVKPVERDELSVERDERVSR
jgi:methylmalonyl-CoA/ethylmalonyl-CoA epimerase